MFDILTYTFIGTTVSALIAFIIKLKIRHIRLCFGLVEIDRQASLVVQNNPEEMKEEPIPIHRKSNSNLNEHNEPPIIYTQRKRNSTARAEDTPIYSKAEYLNEKKKTYQKFAQKEKEREKQLNHHSHMYDDSNTNLNELDNPPNIDTP